jgi:hypothetical protein
MQAEPSQFRATLKHLSKDYEESLLAKLKKKGARKVYTRCVFERIIEVDTKGERFDAEAVVEASWHDDQIFNALLKLNADSGWIIFTFWFYLGNMIATNLFLLDLGSSEFLDDRCLNNILLNIEDFNYYDKENWSPQLYFVNSISVCEEVRFNVRIVPKTNNLFATARMLKRTVEEKRGNRLINNLTALVTEVHKLRGVFYERMEIFDFPIDMQELSITMTSRLSTDQVVLLEDRAKPCQINPDRFCDGQVWYAFDFCNTTAEENTDELNDIQTSLIKMTCFVARKPQFYIYK